MNNVNKTLYIPLYGKALVSKKGLFINDEKAEQICMREGFSLKGKSKSKYLAYYMGMRCVVFDDFTRQKMKQMPDAAVICIGCGLDGRCIRVNDSKHLWYDVDLPEVIKERRLYYDQTPFYKMINGDARQSDWLECISEKSAIVIMEGVSMYLTPNEMLTLVRNLNKRFENVVLLADFYSTFAAKMSKYKNPINDVGVTTAYGMDDPYSIQYGDFKFVKEHSLTPMQYINQLHGAERFIFKNLYAGSFASKLYKLYEYNTEI